MSASDRGLPLLVLQEVDPANGSMLSVIKAVFLDGDQTLWDFEKLMRRAMLATLGELKTLRPGRRPSSSTLTRSSPIGRP